MCVCVYICVCVDDVLCKCVDDVCMCVLCLLIIIMTEMMVLIPFYYTIIQYI